MYLQQVICLFPPIAENDKTIAGYAMTSLQLSFKIKARNDNQIISHGQMKTQGVFERCAEMKKRLFLLLIALIIMLSSYGKNASVFLTNAVAYPLKSEQYVLKNSVYQPTITLRMYCHTKIIRVKLC